MKYSTILWDVGGDHLAAIYEAEMIHEVPGNHVCGMVLPIQFIGGITAIRQQEPTEQTNIFT